MSFVLKIVEGPNKGAEVALVEGVAVTMGKGDECDIVLADSSMPNAPSKIETTTEGVSVDGELLAPLHVTTIGDTSFAVGPADGPWGKLVWPSPEKPADEPAEEKDPEAPAPQTQDNAVEEKKIEKKKSHGCLIWFIAILLLSVALAGVGYYYRDWLMPRVEPYRPQAEAAWGWTKSHAKTSYGWCSEKCISLYGRFANRKDSAAVAEPERDPAEIIAELALENGLEIKEEDGTLAISGNLKTRAERLAVTAKAYATLPCVELNLSDDETLKTAVEDTLNLIGESGLRVRAVTNRVAVLDGSTSDFVTVMTRISQEVPKLKTIEGGSVARQEQFSVEEVAEVDTKEVGEKPVATPVVQPKMPMPTLPVCGILTTPYPCLVTRSGARILEGANIGEWTVVKIGADSVVLDSAMGRFVWKP